MPNTVLEERRDENKNVFEFFSSRKHNFFFFFTQHFVAMYEYAHNTVGSAECDSEFTRKKNSYYAVPSNRFFSDFSHLHI